MVIAPLLGPNVALALAATLGDIQLARDARKANFVGIVGPLFFSALVGVILGSSTFAGEILSRTEVSLSGITTFLIQGVRPLWWWDKQRAKKATKRAMTAWIFCLLLLIVLILASKRWNR